MTIPPDAEGYFLRLEYFFPVGKLTKLDDGLPSRKSSVLSPEVLSRWQQYSSVSSMQEMRKAAFIPCMSSRNPTRRQTVSPARSPLPPTNWRLATASTRSTTTSSCWFSRASP
ncbi:hypothetical protein EMIT0P2_110160 [Pseudomonas sp. IT-P2]